MIDLKNEYIICVIIFHIYIIIFIIYFTYIKLIFYVKNIMPHTFPVKTLGI